VARILAALHLYSPHHNAGAETMLHALLKALVARGHQVCVQMTMPHPMHAVGPYEYEGVSVWPYRASDDLWCWCTTPHLRPDLIISHLDSAQTAVMLQKTVRIPAIIVAHNTHEASKVEVARGPAFVIYNSQWMREDYEQWAADWGYELPPHLVIRPPIYPADYEVELLPGTQRCITLVNLTEPKGAHIFYELARRFPNRRFLGVQGAYGRQVIRDLPNVEISPHVAAHDMPEQVYRRVQVLLVPSSYESYGRVAVEAACSGIPVIAHPTPGLLESLGTGGIFCDRDDLDAWEKALRRLLTPNGYKAASRRVRAVPAALDTESDLIRWCDAVEAVLAHHRVTV
jgi:glycosyltransferase involved in cell wall biosynthesis